MANTAQDQTNLQQQIMANPAALAALRANASKPQGGRMTGDPRFRMPTDQILKQFGINVPGDQHVEIDPNTGDVVANHLSWFQRNADWLLPVATIGGGAAVGALAGGGTPAAAGTDGALASSGSPGLASLPSGAGSSLMSAGGSAAAAGGFSLGSLIRPAVSGITALAANRSLSGANNTANDFLQKATQQGLDINKGILDNSTQAAQQAYDRVTGGFQPYQQVGQQGLTSLSSLAGMNRPDLVRRPDFTLPTADEARAMPGYQFGLDQGVRGVNASAAARGGLLTGGAVKAADKFANDYASTKYGELANLAANAYNINATNDLNVYNANGVNFDRPFNRAMTLAELGQYGTSGAANAANNLANQTINAGGQYGQNATNLLTAGANANAANAQANGRNNAGTFTTLGNLIQDYLANQGRY